MEHTLTFNVLLRAAGLDPVEVRLIRHKDQRACESIYEYWRKNDPFFEVYQSVQRSSKSFPIGCSVASFVVTPNRECLFVGIWNVLSRRVVLQGENFPISGIESIPGEIVHNLEASGKLEELIGRLVIDWGPGALAYVQHAGRQDKPILEIRKNFSEPKFPGFQRFQWDTSEIDRLYGTWKSVLASVHGVYLLVASNGDQYVGSAYGDDGFLGRFSAYARDGHGGNVKLKKARHQSYSASILEVMGSAATMNEIIARESEWKVKLGTRAHGLNSN